MHGDEQDTIDERIDAAVRRYAEAPQFSEPRVALARVRARAEQEPERRWWVWAWVVPSAAMAALIGLVLVWVLRVPRAPQIAWIPKAPTVASVEQPDLPHAEKANAGPSLRRKSPRRSSAQDDNGLVMAQVRKLPKQEVFPTPQPLSRQEQALLAVATLAPEATKQLIDAQEHMGDPIQIAAITIRPLNEDEQQSAPKGKEMR